MDTKRWSRASKFARWAVPSVAVWVAVKFAVPVGQVGPITFQPQLNLAASAPAPSCVVVVQVASPPQQPTPPPMVLGERNACTMEPSTLRASLMQMESPAADAIRRALSD